MLKKVNRKIRRWTAWLLMLCMMGNLFSQSALAEGGAGRSKKDDTDSITILSFEELDEDIAWQEVSVGTPFGDLTLPNELWGSRQLASSSDADRISVKVESWESDSIYDDTEEAEAGTEFVFTPVLDERYDVSGAQLPEIVVVLTDGAETASPSDATPSDAERTEVAKKFADGVKSLDADKLMALAQAYVDAAKELAAYTNQEPELIEEVKRAELQKKFEEADTAFWAVYDTVNGQAETSLLKQYEALSEEEKESVGEEYQILNQLIQKVEALLAVMYGVKTLATAYPVVVGDTQVTDANKDDVLGDGKVVFTPAAGSEPATLTLTDATIKGSKGFRLIGTGDRLTCGYGGIVANCPLKIVVKGENDVSSTAKNITASDTYDTYFNSGICMLVSSASELEIVGEEGSVLNVTGGDNSGASAYGSGSLSNIYSAGIALNEGNLTISNVTVNATAGKGKAGPSNNTKSTGICNNGNSITIDHAKVTATSPSTEGALYGLYCRGKLTISNGSDVTATAGTPTTTQPWVYGIWMGNTSDNKIVIKGSGSMLKATHGGGNREYAGAIYSGAASIDTVGDYTFRSGNDENSAGMISTPAKLANVTTPYLGIISNTLPTPAPTFAAGKNTYQMSSKQSVTAFFSVSNYEAGTTYTLYSAATGGSQVTDPSLNRVGANFTFTLDYSAPPTADQNYWVSATKGGIESTSRTKISVKKAVSSECKVLEFRTNALDKETAIGRIDGSALTLALRYEYENMLSALPVALKVSEGATVTAWMGDDLTPAMIDGEKYWTGTYDFSSFPSVPFQVLAEDGLNYKSYTATAKVPSYNVNYDLDSTKVTKKDGEPTIRAGEPITAVFSPKTGYSLDPDWVTVKCGTTILSKDADYTVSISGDMMTVNVAASAVNGNITIKVEAKGTASQLTGFTVANQVGNTVIDQTNRTVTVIMPIGTNLSAVSPTVTVSQGATVSPASGVSTDFSNSETTPVTYKVTAEDGKTIQEYKVTVKIVKYQIDYTFTMIQPDTSYLDEIGMNQPLNLTLRAETGYTLPANDDTENLEVMMGGTRLTADQYTYQVAQNRTTATFSIAKVTGDVRFKLNALHAAKELNSFVIKNAFTTVIDRNNHTIHIEMPYQTDLTKLKPEITISDHAKVSPLSGVERDFTTPQTYTITAANGDTQAYTVTVKIPTFTVNYPAADHVTKVSGAENVALKQPFEATFKADEGYILRTVVTQGVTTLVETTDYTWEYDETDKIYTLSLPAESVTKDLKVAVTAYSTAAEMLTFNIKDSVQSSTAGDVTTYEMSTGTSLGTLIPEFTVSPDASVTVMVNGKKVRVFSGSTKVNFGDGTVPVIFTVTAEDGITTTAHKVIAKIPSYQITYELSNIEADPDHQTTAELNEKLGLTFKAKDGHTVPDSIEVVMGGAALSPGGYTYTVAPDRLSATFVIEKVTGEIRITLAALRSGKDIESFAIGGQYGDTKLNPGKKTIDVEMPHGTDLKKLKPGITFSDGATVNPADGVEVDFTNPQTYTVTAENGDTQAYTVTVEIPTFTVNYPAAAHVTKESGAENVELKQSFEATFRADEGYILRTKVTRGNTTLEENTDYTWNDDDADGIYEINLLTDSVIGNLTITTTAYNTKTELTGFAIPNQVYDTKVSADGTIEIQMPFGTKLDKLTPTFTLSDGATSVPASNTEQDFSASGTTAFTYTVTAQDGETIETYRVKVTIPTFTISYSNSDDHMQTTSVKPTEAALMETPVIILKSETGYTVPKAGDTENLTVTMDGKTLTEGKDFLYLTDSTNNMATLTIKDVSADVTVYVNALSVASEMTGFWTNRDAGDAVEGEIAEGDDHKTVKLTLPHDFDEDMTALPIRLLASEHAEVTKDGLPLETEAITEGGETKTYWVGTYDFKAGYIDLMVTAQDEEYQTTYRVTATIPEYDVSYASASNITRESGKDSLQWLESLTATFQAAENYEQQDIVVKVGNDTLTADDDYTFSYDEETRISTLTIPASQVTDKITITPRAYHTKAELTDFHIEGEVRRTVSDDGKTIRIEMPSTTILSSLRPEFVISDAASAVPGNQAEVDFSNSADKPVVYTVTAEDGKTTETYEVTVVIPTYQVSSTLTNIDLSQSMVQEWVELHGSMNIDLYAKEGYTMPEEDDTDHLIVKMKDGDTVKTLTAGTDYRYTANDELSQINILISKFNQESVLITGDISIEVKALSVAKSIDSFRIENQVGETRLDETKHRIEVDMPYGTDLTAIVPTITVNDEEASVSPASQAQTDFAASLDTPVIYTVTAENGTTQEYDVVVSIPEYEVGYDLTDVTAEGQPRSMELKQELEVTLTAVDGHSVPETILIAIDADGQTAVLTEGTDYTYVPDTKKDTATIRLAKDLPAAGAVTITADGESRKKQITEFTVENQVGTTVIDETEKTILVVVPYGTDRKTVKPVITATDSNATVSPESGQPEDFTDSRTTPVIYTVTAEDRSTQEYQVTVRYPEVKVTFDTLGGTQEAQQELIAGDKAEKPADPVKETDGTRYYAFDGWYADAGYQTAYDFGKQVPADITIYARWKAGYKVITEAVNGTVTTSERDDTRIFYPGETVTVKATADKNYRFEDWKASIDAALLPDPEKAENTFIMPEGTVSLTASFKRKSSGGGGGGGTSSSGTVAGGGVTGGSGTISVGEITTTPSADGGTIDQALITASKGEQAAVQVKKDAAGNVVSREAAISMEQIQATTSGQQTSITYNVDSNLVKQAAQTSGATIQSPLQVTIPVSAEALTPQIQNPQVQSVTVNLVIPTAVTVASDIRVQEIRLEKGVVEAAKAAGKDITVSVKNEAGIELVSWNFNGAELKNSRTAVSDINLAVDLTPVPAIDAARKELKEAIQPVGKDGLVITFHHSGQLPATARIRMPSTVQRADGIGTNIQAGDVVRLYYYNPQAKRLEAVGADTYVVDAQNYVTIALNHCSEYVLIPVRAENQTPAQETKPSQTAGTHTVQAGDNLWKIASRYGCSVDDLKAANPGIVETDLRIGQILNVPTTSFAQ